jgi:hypothetical protein
MWAGVTSRFRTFGETVLLTDDQIEDGRTKTRGITIALNSAYWGHDSPDYNSFWVGSWGKRTQARPPRDVDVFFVLPDSNWPRIQQLQGNKQSLLLQEVKRVLQGTYPQTDMRGDGQVVMVAFNTITVEVVPVFRGMDGKFIFADSNNGGQWHVADPGAEIRYIEDGDLLTSRYLRAAIRMLKILKRECNVPIKSYVLETLVTNYLVGWPHRHEGFFYFDWLMRDFFAFLIVRANTWVTVADRSQVWLGADWKSRAESAYARSVRACDYEQANMIANAGDQWQKIFGAWIQKHAIPEPSLLLKSA